MIPKAAAKLRRLGIPPVTRSWVRAALRLVLEPSFEADFRRSSDGFRPNRRTSRSWPASLPLLHARHD